MKALAIAVRIVVPLALLATGFAFYHYFLSTEKPARKRAPRRTVVAVEATALRAADFQVVLQSQGTVRPRTASVLIPEVAGQVVWVAPAFREGGFFEAGEALLRIDDRDYHAAVTLARASVAQVELRLADEEARAAQAREDWERLGDGAKPTLLALRVPQVAEARAAVEAAGARLEQAQRDLGRTTVTVPYAGRVLEKLVDIGQHVSPGTRLGSVYAVDYVEVRLPLPVPQLAHLDLPESHRGAEEGGGVNGDPEEEGGPVVVLSAPLGDGVATWKGRLVRSEGAIDTRSRQNFVVARVDDPYAEGRPPLKVGLFVEAEIEGRVMENVIAVPREAVRENRFVLVVDPAGRIRRREIHPVWQDRAHAVVPAGRAPAGGNGGAAASIGLDPGEHLCLTPLPYAVEGMPVRATVDGVPPPAGEGNTGAGGRGSVGPGRGRGAPNP